MIWSRFLVVVLFLYICCHPVSSCSLLVWRIGIWGDGFRIVFSGFWQFGAVSGGLWKHVVVIIPKSMDHPWKQYNHEPIWVQPDAVCGRTKFGIPISGVDWVDSLGIHLVGNAWVKEWTLLRTTQWRGALDDLDWHLRSNLSGYCSYGKPLNSLVVMS
jgi:hypothetical protein